MTSITFTEYENVQRASKSMPPMGEAHWVAEYAPLVKRVVGKLAGPGAAGLEQEDLEQIGIMGLLEALRRYGEPDDEFANYAVVRIRGAVLDELRRLDWRPRTARQGAHRLRTCERALRSKLGREPGKDDICAALDIDGAEYDRIMLDDCANEFMSLDDVLSAYGDLPGDAHASPESQVLARRGIEQALLVLSEREQRVIQFYYQFDLSLPEIGAVMNLTTARICQLHRGALRKMRGYLERQ